MDKLTKNTFIQWEWDVSKEIELEGNLIVANLIRWEWEYNLRYKTYPDADVDLRVLIVTDNKKTQKVNIQAILNSSHSKINLHIIALVLDGELILDGGIFIPPGVAKVEWHLLEENIILGENIKITSLPRLDVRSNDVAASHWAKIEKLDELKMFYLRSKGLSKKQAQLLLIDWYIHKFFEGLDDTQQLEQELMNYFQNNL